MAVGKMMHQITTVKVNMQTSSCFVTRNNNNNHSFARQFDNTRKYKTFCLRDLRDFILAQVG